jgi:hypothetical protein
MQAEKDKLIELAERISVSTGEAFKSRWCFFAGFAFLLNGVEKVTNDIDLLAKDEETFQHVTKVLLKLGMKSIATTKSFTSFKVVAPALDKAMELTLDLLCISSELLAPLKDMWETLEAKRIGGFTLPLPSPIYLILLKILVNSHRQQGDKKKQQDLVDVRQLMSIRGLTPKQVRNEAKRQGLDEVTEEFLSRLKTIDPPL